MNSLDNTVPPLEAFWAIHDEAYYDEEQMKAIYYEPADPRYVQFSTGIASHQTDRRYSYLLIKDLNTDIIWGVKIHSPGSWLEEYREAYVSGPFKMNATPRQITVYDYTEVEDGVVV